MRHSLLTVNLLVLWPGVTAFSLSAAPSLRPGTFLSSIPSKSSPKWRHHDHPRCAYATPSTSLMSSSVDSPPSGTFAYRSIFNFSDSTEGAVDSFERIDDAIMGGISLSSIKQVPGEDFARWSGICRTDGGGFCGTRTLPFEEPLLVRSDAQGLYLLCRFTSDSEPQRRIWKLTTRTEASRGERLYQAMFEIPVEEDGGEMEWQVIRVPFDSFSQVRGPRLVPGSPPLNTTGGLFQIGISLSKFQMGVNMTEVPNFRPGFFELQLKEIGLYTSSGIDGGNASFDAALGNIQPVKTLSKEEVEEKRPFLLKLLSPVFKLLFSEKKRRRASAARMLEKRGSTRWDLVRYGFRNRIARKGVLGAIMETSALALQESVSLVVVLTLRLAVFYPFVYGRRLVKLLGTMFQNKIQVKKK